MPNYFILHIGLILQLQMTALILQDVTPNRKTVMATLQG